MGKRTRHSSPRWRLPVFVAAAVVGGPVALAVLGTVPAGSHSAAKCKFEIFDDCLANSLPHAYCVAKAESLCAGHTHTGGSGVGGQAVGDGFANPSGGSQLGRGTIIPTPVKPRVRRY